MIVLAALLPLEKLTALYVWTVPEETLRWETTAPDPAMVRTPLPIFAIVPPLVTEPENVEFWLLDPTLSVIGAGLPSSVLAVPLPLRLPKVNAPIPEANVSWPPVLTVTDSLLAAAELASCTAPALTNRPPEKLLLPEVSVNVPAPFCVTLPAPVIAPEKVELAPLAPTATLTTPPAVSERLSAPVPLSPPSLNVPTPGRNPRTLD